MRLLWITIIFFYPWGSGLEKVFSIPFLLYKATEWGVSSGETSKTEVTCHLGEWSLQEIYKHNFFVRIFGSYEALEGGHARDALVNMTGGVGEDISVADYTESEEKRKKLFQILNSAIEDRALISASISVKKIVIPSNCQSTVQYCLPIASCHFWTFQVLFLLHVTFTSLSKKSLWSIKKITFNNLNLQIYYSKKPFQT